MLVLQVSSAPALSVLDLSPVPSGTTPAGALQNTVDLARHAEALGLARYWLAEHHNAASLASSSPEVLIATIAATTTRLRVGSGGIMLPNHSSLKVAETFRALHALHPGRIDLGVGRAAGTDNKTALALRRTRELLGAARASSSEPTASPSNWPSSSLSSRATRIRSCASVR
jgi:luciferase family oxidoreductase group 1